MTQIGVPRELHPGESRVPVVPQTVARLASLGAAVCVEAGCGAASGFSDEEYRRAGAAVESARAKVLETSDVILRLRKPPESDLVLCRPGGVQIGFFDPFNSPELLDGLVRRNLTALCMELVPRITRAQKMDALSSQASLAGYAAVILAAERLNKIFPMMMTPAGTIPASRVFVLGAGVAGLQAIATAHRLGARVEAFDTRPAVEEQVKSLGAKFVKVDLGETGQTKDGYARQLSFEQLDRQRQVMAKTCAQSDVVITAAQVFGAKAPVIVTADMVRAMRPGSVVVDTAVETGGNVEGSILDKEITVGGVRVIGLGNLPGRVCAHASLMYSSNLGHFVESFWNREKKNIEPDFGDEIIRGCLLVHGGEIKNETVKTRMKRG